MTRIILVAVAALSFSVPATGAAHKSKHGDCVTVTPRDYSTYAKKVYRRTTVSDAAHRHLATLQRCASPAARKIIRRIHRREIRARRERQLLDRYTPYGKWAIPGYIVACESEGRNLSPNSASAAGYYQIISSTWYAYGGGRYASEADYASLLEQSIVASKIWDGGRGASQWDCA